MRMALITGRTLQNRYRVASLLGKGGMGAVYRAWDTRLNVPVALKEMVPQPGLDAPTLAQLRLQFKREANVLARMKHPHLVRVTDFFEEGGNAYLVMDFVEGESLGARIAREGVLPEGQVLTWAGQLLGALAYCHEQGVLHRDVKPQNVIVTPKGEAVLVDFGLVKLWDPNDPSTKTAIRAMGTPEYAPPEQYDLGVGHTDQRSDLYSLGATLYHALTGQAPPTATQRIVSPKVLAPVRSLNPRVSPHVEAALARAMELQPDARFCDAQEMAAALRAKVFISRPQQPTKVMAEAVSATSGGRGKRAAWTWVGIAGGLVAGVALIAACVAAVVLVFYSESTGTVRSVPVASLTSLDWTGTRVASAVTDTPLPAFPTLEPTTRPEPTSTPPPTPIPLPTSTPQPTHTPTPACPTVTGPFAAIWQAEQTRLGCAANEAHVSWMAQEHFERGQMFWRKDDDVMIVLYNTGAWELYVDSWQESDPQYSCPESAPSETPPTPLRGFGKIWCTYEAVRNGLGWATDYERGFDGTVQDFERGSILRTDGGETYVLYGDGNWARR
jgi:serine/threonine protein kinase